MLECAFTSPVSIELGMLVMYCMTFVMSVSVVYMVSCCGVSSCYVYVDYGDVRSCISVVSLLMACSILMCVTVVSDLM